MKSSTDRILIIALAGCLLIATVVGAGVFLWFSWSARSLIADSRFLSIHDVSSLTSIVKDEAVRKALAAGDWENAASGLEKLVADNPSDAALRRALGQVLYNAAAKLFEDGGEDRKALERCGSFLQRAAPYLDQDKALLAQVWQAAAAVGIREYEAGAAAQGKARIQGAKVHQPNDPYVSYALGAILCKEGSYAAAMPHLKIAVTSPDKEIQKASQQLLSKVAPDVKQEETFGVTESARFVIRYEGPTRTDIAWTVLSALDREVSKVQSVVGSVPARKIEVIVYTSDRFAQQRGLPDWVGGVFDGRIRIGLGDVTAGGDRLHQLLGHEFAHAAVFDKLGKPAPTWLDEGIAQVVEYGRSPEARDIVNRLQGQAWKLSQLDRSFMQLSGAGAQSAYAYSHAAVGHISSRFGSGAIHTILYHMANGMAYEAAIRQATGRTLDQLDAEIHQSLGIGS